MRKDMSKVITEPGRRKVYGGEKGYDRVNRYFHQTEDEEFEDYRPCHESMRRHYLDRNEFDDLLTPISRFLEKNIGNLWNDVYSEICRVAPFRSTLGAHLRIDHSKQAVILDAVMDEEGNPHWFKYNGFGRGNDYLYDSLYVHPETGLLCKAPRHPKYVSKPSKVEHVKLSDLEYNIKIKGSWFYVRLVKKAKDIYGRFLFSYSDVVLKLYNIRGINNFDKAQKLVPYRVNNYSAVYKRQLSKKEIRKIE